jgi:hypothetical protein
MTQDDKPSNKPDAQSRQSVDAVRHVGPTLESEKERVYVPKTDWLSPEEQVAAEDDLHVHTVAPSGELKEGAEPEPLKTRLPGDTSSDPHTDVETDLGQDKPRNAA